MGQTPTKEASTPVCKTTCLWFECKPFWVGLQQQIIPSESGHRHEGTWLSLAHHRLLCERLQVNHVVQVPCVFSDSFPHAPAKTLAPMFDEDGVVPAFVFGDVSLLRKYAGCLVCLPNRLAGCCMKPLSKLSHSRSMPCSGCSPMLGPIGY